MKYIFFDEQKIADAEKRVIAIHEQEYHCSESLIRTLWPIILPDEPLTPAVLRMVMPLRGGMASTMSSHCGGLTIGLLMIGAVYGREAVDEGDQKLAPALCRRYWQMYLEEFGTSNCTLLRSGEPGPEAPSRCGCIMVRSVRLLLELFNDLYREQPDLETIYAYGVDRSQEPCHERVVPIQPKEF